LQSGDPLLRKKVEILKALSEETRLKILDLLREGEKCQCEIIPSLGKSQSTISQHAQILIDAGILDYERQAQRKIYRVKRPSVFKLLEILHELALDSIMETSELVEKVKET